MGNTTYFLDPIVTQTLENSVVKVQRTVDFSKLNVASGSTLDIFNVPAGAAIINAGIYAKTGEASVTATLGQDGDSGNDNLIGATDVGTTGNIATTGEAYAPVVVAAADVIRSAIGGANATTAVLTYWIVYTVVAL